MYCSSCCIISPVLITAGEDFHTLVQTLEFHSEENLINVNVKIIDDESVENNETFVIYLTSGAGVKLSPYAQTKVTINDDDHKGAQFFIVCIKDYQCTINLVINTMVRFCGTLIEQPHVNMEVQ